LFVTSAPMDSPGPAMRSEPAEHRTSELIVQAEAHDVRLEADIVRDCAAADAAIELAEVDVEIFDLGGPVAQEGVFEAAAEGPAELRGAGRGGQPETGRGGLDVAERAAGREVRQEASKGVADAAARRPEPSVVRFANGAPSSASPAIAAVINLEFICLFPLWIQVTSSSSESRNVRELARLPRSQSKNAVVTKARRRKLASKDDAQAWHQRRFGRPK